MNAKKRIVIGALLLMAGALLLALSIFFRHSPEGRWYSLGALVCIASANLLNVIGSTKQPGKPGKE